MSPLSVIASEANQSPRNIKVYIRWFHEIASGMIETKRLNH